MLLPFACFAQAWNINTKDSLKTYTNKLINKALAKQKFRNIAIWDFTNQQKETTKAGMYIADLMSIYATENDSIVVLDRQNINSIIREHNLKDKDFLIDQNALLQLGKFSGAEVLIVGKVNIFETSCLIQVYVKLVDVNTAKTLSAADENIPIDRKFADASQIEMNCLGADLKGPCDFGSGNSKSPQNSEDQLIAKRLKAEGCEDNNTGAYCFCNSTGRVFSLTVYGTAVTGNNQWTDWAWGPKQEFKLKPFESKCIYGMAAGNSYRFTVDSTMNPADLAWKHPFYDEGNIHVEKCKFKSYTIKDVIINAPKKAGRKLLDEGIKTGIDKGLEYLRDKLKIKKE